MNNSLNIFIASKNVFKMSSPVVCACMCSHICLHADVEPEANVGYFPQLFYTLLFETGPLTEHGAQQFRSKTNWPVSSGLLFHLPSARIRGVCLHTGVLGRVGIRTGVLMLVLLSFHRVESPAPLMPVRIRCSSYSWSHEVEGTVLKLKTQNSKLFTVPC